MSSTDAEKSAHLTLLVGLSMGKPKIDLCLHFAHLAEAWCLHLLCYVEVRQKQVYLFLSMAAKLKTPVGSGAGQAVRKLELVTRCSFPGVCNAFARVP